MGKKNEPPSKDKCHEACQPGSAIAEHLPQRLLLVGSQDGHGLQVDVDVRVDGVVPEVVLGQQRKVQLHGPLLQRFKLLLQPDVRGLVKSCRLCFDIISSTTHFGKTILDRMIVIL